MAKMELWLCVTDSCISKNGFSSWCGIHTWSWGTHAWSNPAVLEWESWVGDRERRYPGCRPNPRRSSARPQMIPVNRLGNQNNVSHDRSTLTDQSDNQNRVKGKGVNTLDVFKQNVEKVKYHNLLTNLGKCKYKCKMSTVVYWYRVLSFIWEARWLVV